MSFPMLKNAKCRICENFHYGGMGKWCRTCGKIMKNPNLTHCSDECLLAGIKKSRSLGPDGMGAESWNEDSDPWV